MDRTADRKRRRAAGGDAVDAGKAFEALITAELELERKAGRIARHDRHQPLYRCVGPGRYVPAAKGGADHFGLLGGGLAFAVEDKSVVGASLPWTRLTEGERLHLQDVFRAGGLALLAVELRPAGARKPLRYLAPWDRVGWRKSGSGVGVGLLGLAGWELREGEALRRFVVWCKGCRAWRLTWHVAGACCFSRTA